MHEIPDLSIAELRKSYRERSLSPVEVTKEFFDLIGSVDERVHAYVTLTAELAYAQAAEAERLYAAGEDVGPLAGIPVSVKDAFHISGVPTSFGSKLYSDFVAKSDSGVVRRLRSAGSVFLGKTNTAEFCQSATCENLLGPVTGNPWDVQRTPGGSSGGAASSIAAHLATVGVGSDGGGSIRIPASFCGIFGFKPSYGLVPDEKGFRGMTDFVCAGPMTRRVDDARVVLGVLADRDFGRSEVGRLRIGYCARPEGRPVESGVAEAIDRTAVLLAEAGHEVIPTGLPLSGWQEIFGPLVLEDEHRERGHLLPDHAEDMTRYQRSTLRAAKNLDPQEVERALSGHPDYRARIATLFSDFDLLLTPATATTAFRHGQRPDSIEGESVDPLWGAFPFAVPFNVAGAAAASIPVGLSDGMPVGAQLVAADGRDQLLLNVCEQIEEAAGFALLEAGDHATASA